ncbi:MAG: 2-enoate reductase FldZ [Deltaproteobacteria bacterium ADurb.Bin510]|nr:MAG: 2-enoate reductase FldZ [Deltaproteobacteria bacterium ADurb.Bin510]
MEAARVLALRGFKPVLFEQAAVLGGQIRMASILPHKDKVLWLLDHLERQLLDLGVEIRLNTAPSMDEIKALQPWAVFLATGARPSLPPIEGIDQPQVCTVDRVLRGELGFTGKRVAVLGSGLTGLETALYLAGQGNQVTVVEVQKQIGPGVLPILLMDVLPRLRELGVQLLADARLTAVAAGCIKLEGAVTELEVDAVVVAAGVKSRRELLDELEVNFENVQVIGDAARPGKIGNAMYAGFDQAYVLS